MIVTEIAKSSYRLTVVLSIDSITVAQQAKAHTSIHRSRLSSAPLTRFTA